MNRQPRVSDLIVPFSPRATRKAVTPALVAWTTRKPRIAELQYDRLWRVACWEAAAIECEANGWWTAARSAWEHARAVAKAATE